MTRDTIARACGGLLMLAPCAAPAMAEDGGTINAKGYANLFGGPIWAGGNSSGNIAFEGGVRVAPHLMVFGTLGHFKDLQADLQPTLTNTAAALSATASRAAVSAAGASVAALPRAAERVLRLPQGRGGSSAIARSSVATAAT